MRTDAWESVVSALGRWSNSGDQTTAAGTRLIGHVPHVALLQSQSHTLSSSKGRSRTGMIISSAPPASGMLTSLLRSDVVVANEAFLERLAPTKTPAEPLSPTGVPDQIR